MKEEYKKQQQSVSYTPPSYGVTALLKLICCFETNRERPPESVEKICSPH